MSARSSNPHLATAPAAPPPPAGTNLHRIDVVADRLGVHVQTVRKWIRDGRLEATRLGGLVYISDENFDRFVAENSTDA